jgi:hypothetical protein
MLLAVALPVFVVADWPVAGYAAAAGAWLVARVLGAVADRRVLRFLRAGDRRSALGLTAAVTLARVWLVAIAVLVVGLVGHRSDGLAGALLALAVVTIYLAGTFLSRFLSSGEAA